MIGFPSVGKSTLLNKVTNTTSAVAATEFTTLTAIPGVMEIEGAKVQLLDLPGIVEGAAQGRGRGRQVVAVAHTADLIMMILDITKPDSQRELLTQELEAVGVRLNQTKPDVTIKPKTAGGVTITVTAPLTKIDEKMIKQILQSYRMHNADVMIREDINVDQFIDCVLNNRSYIKCLYCYNKIDQSTLETVDQVSRLPHSFVVSCEAGYNMDRLNQKIWTALDLNRVYTKKRGERPDLEQPLIIRQGGTVEHVIHSIHRGLVEKFKYALVWGKSSKFNPQPQRVGLHHVLSPDDVITIFTK
ncbi:P-loop containing nucleoside triphosphate hydrolase protein [Phakopsora pachyrhizi]|nr:P-loop containing nucleoside triphosphate hydrolase protein [Phakopsora pachyrhizi]